MQKKIFITQSTLDKWASEGKLTLDGDEVTLHTNDNPKYKLTPAAKFLAIDTQPEDPHNLVGKIVPLDLLKKRDVEVYMESAIYKDDAYKVEQGFAAVLVEAAGEVHAPEPVKEEKIDDSAKSDEELLTEFFLKNI